MRSFRALSRIFLLNLFVICVFFGLLTDASEGLRGLRSLNEEKYLGDAQKDGPYIRTRGAETPKCSTAQDCQPLLIVVNPDRRKRDTHYATPPLSQLNRSLTQAALKRALT
eukprot:Selendium_serpulae@DN6452_c0_g1_i1.p1